MLHCSYSQFNIFCLAVVINLSVLIDVFFLILIVYSYVYHLTNKLET